MSYRRFVNELEALIKKDKENASYQADSKDYLLILVNKWADEGRFQELIDYIKENYNAGNCDEYIEYFRKVLKESNSLEYLVKLWIAVLNNRIKTLNDSVSSYSSEITNFSTEEAKEVNYFDYKLFRTNPSKNNISHRIGFLTYCILQGCYMFLEDLRVFKSASIQHEVIALIASCQEYRMVKLPLFGQKNLKTTNLPLPEVGNFWEIIEFSKKMTKNDSDLFFVMYESIYDNVNEDIKVSHLSFLNSLLDQIYREEIFAIAAFYFKNCSNDKFEKFCNWIIYNGQTVYNNFSALKVKDICELLAGDCEISELGEIFENSIENNSSEVIYCKKRRT